MATSPNAYRRIHPLSPLEKELFYAVMGVEATSLDGTEHILVVDHLDGDPVSYKVPVTELLETGLHGDTGAVDNAILRADGITGNVVQDSLLTIADDGTLAMADAVLERPVLQDYAETINNIGAIGGGACDIDLELGNIVAATVDTAATTFTFSNPPSGAGGSFTLVLTNGGSQTVNWPASVLWAVGGPPVLTAAGIDILTFLTLDGGTTWYGFIAGLDFA